MIKGGYVLQPRIFEKSDASKMPPVTRELWFYILRNVNHKGNGKFKRGDNFFSIPSIQEDLSWYVGFRKEKYSKTQIYKAIRRLCGDNMIATMKTTRGLIITVCNYDYYQNPKNYEDNNERTVKGSEGSHYKQECNNERSIILKSGEVYIVPEDDIKYYNDVYHNIDIDLQIKKMNKWCEDNPSKKKTFKGIKRFITGWLDRAKPAQEDTQIKKELELLEGK